MASNPFDQFDAPAVRGQLQAGNIDLHTRPVVRNPDGSISTVRSISANFDGREVLIPTVSDDGRIMTNDEAIQNYRRTGKHLGMFDTPENATAYAENLHNDQAREYGAGGNPFDQFDDISTEPTRTTSEPTPQRTGWQELGRQLGLTARLPVDAIAAIPLAAADAGIAARNLLTGSNYDSASKMYQEGMASLFPTPETGIEKGVNLVGSAVAGSRLPVPGVKNPAPTVQPAPVANTAQQVITQGEKHGVPVFFDDVTQSTVAKKLGVAAEPLGVVGTGSRRAIQGKAAQSAAREMVDRYTPATGDDVPELVQKGLQTKLKSFKGAAAKLYSRAAQTLDPMGNVPRANFDKVITDEAAKQSQLGTLASDDVLRLLEKYRNAPVGNFSTMRELRSQLGEEISDFYTGKNAAIGQRGVTALRAMQEALEADMAGFAKQSGNQGYQAWKAADGFYKANLVPFKEAGFRDLVKTAEPEKAWRYLLAQGSLKSRSVRMYNSLDEPGRSAVRYGLVKDALENGTNPNGSFSPAKFAKYLEDHESAVNTFFKGRDLQEIQGFRNLMRHVERAGQYAENPPTGQRLIPYLFGGAALVEPSAAAGVAGSGLAVKALFQTKAGRDLLLAMGRAKPGSAGMDALRSRTARFLAVSAASPATRAQTDSPSKGRQPEAQRTEREPNSTAGI